MFLLFARFFFLLVGYMYKLIWKLLQTELFLFLILVIFGFGNIYIILSYPCIIILAKVNTTKKIYEQKVCIVDRQIPQSTSKGFP